MRISITQKELCRLQGLQKAHKKRLLKPIETEAGEETVRLFGIIYNSQKLNKIMEIGKELRAFYLRKGQRLHM